MLYIFAVLLIGLWILGLITSTGGGVLHVLLVAAVVMIVINLSNSRKRV